MSWKININHFYVGIILSLLFVGIPIIKSQNNKIRNLNELSIVCCFSNAQTMLLLDENKHEEAKLSCATGIREASLGLIDYKINSPDSLNYLRHLMAFRQKYKNIISDEEFALIKDFVNDNSD